jgi:hypothetical protein
MTRRTFVARLAAGVMAADMLWKSLVWNRREAAYQPDDYVLLQRINDGEWEPVLGSYWKDECTITIPMGSLNTTIKDGTRITYAFVSDEEIDDPPYLMFGTKGKRESWT